MLGCALQAEVANVRICRHRAAAYFWGCGAVWGTLRWRWRKKVVVVHCSALLSRLVISDKETHTQSPGELHYALPSYININSLQYYYYYKRQQEEPLLGDKCCR